MIKADFKFKKFSINQDQCAMKIGTDGVLLGAWTSLDKEPDSILDIGTGTGIIALQLAQRSSNLKKTVNVIDAIEIDPNAFQQAVGNFENSPWSDRLFCYHAPLKEFVSDINEKYDLIVSNPPFFKDSYRSISNPRNTARLTTSLSFEDLLFSVSKLLTPNGVFSVIIPFNEEDQFIDLAFRNKLILSKICRVQGNLHSKIKRSLLEFSFLPNKVKVSKLILEKKRHDLTDEYKALVKGFYLKY
jgi:tRNA1Val (adenine37-N6)-methyltransferase